MASSSPIANSSIQLWLDFNGTLPAVIPPCQQRENDYGFMNSSNITFQNCTEICNEEHALTDPLLSNNLLTCGLWALFVEFEKSVGPYSYSEDPVPFMALGLDHQNTSYADSVQRNIGSVLGDMCLVAKAGTSSITSAIPRPCTKDRLFAQDYWVLRYVAPY